MFKGVTGLMGSGKGVYTVCPIVHQVLQDTDQHIITNFALKLHPWNRALKRRKWKPELGLLAALREQYEGQDFDAEKRIHVIEDDFSHFYLWRIDDSGKLIRIDAKKDDKGKVVGFDEAAFNTTQGCTYIADESGLYWGARSWMKNEAGLNFYLRQHRKAEDDVWFLMQTEKDVDRQCRDVIQEWHSLVNHKHRRIGPFKQPDVISCFVSPEPPSQRGKVIGHLPRVIHWDKRLVGGSFDTAKGVGVQGRAADIFKKAKGVPTWALPLGIVGAGLLVVGAARAFGWGTGKLLTQAPKMEAGQMVKSALARGPAPLGLQVPGPLPVNQTGAVQVAAGRTAEPLARVVGVMVWPRGSRKIPSVKVILDDGVILTSEDDNIQQLAGPGKPVIVNGVKYEWSKTKPNDGLDRSSAGSPGTMAAPSGTTDSQGVSHNGGGGGWPQSPTNGKLLGY